MVFFHRGGQIRSRYQYGGSKLLTFQQNHNTCIALSVPKGEAKLHWQFNFDGGHGRICPPWIRHWTSMLAAASHVIPACPPRKKERKKERKERKTERKKEIKERKKVR